MIRYFFLFFCAFLLLLSCRKEVDIFVDEDPITDPPAELVSTSIYGQVISEYALPVPDAVVKIREYEVKTDANGYFEFDHIQANKYGTQIIASKDGFMKNIITVYPRLNQQMFRTIILSQNVNSATFLSSSGTRIEMGSQTRLDIPPNSIVYNSDGSDYTGQVVLNWSRHELTDNHFLNLIPGELIGQDSANIRKGLDPVGILQMSMTDPNGIPLRLAQGKTADLRYQVTSSYKGLLEDKIPMWYYDSKKNKWIESAEGIKTAAKIYETSLPAIADWSLAYPEEIVPFKGTLTDHKGKGLKNFSLTVESGMNKTILSTDHDGYFFGHVPANKPLSVVILNDCGIEVQQEVINAASSDITFDKQVEESADCSTIPVSGVLVDCEGKKLTNGYVLLKTKNKHYFLGTDQEGNISGEFRVCGETDEVTLEAVDYKNNIQAVMDVDILLGDALQLGIWKICDRVDGYISVQFNDRVYLVNQEIMVEQDESDVIFSAASGLFEVECWIRDFSGEGIYLIQNESSADFILTFTPFSQDAPKLVPKDVASLSTFKLEVTKYVKNELIQGKIEGLARDMNNNNKEGMMYIKFSIPLRQ